MSTCPKADELLIANQARYQKIIADQTHVFKHGYFSQNEAVLKTNKIYSEVNILT